MLYLVGRRLRQAARQEDVQGGPAGVLLLLAIEYNMI